MFRRGKIEKRKEKLIKGVRKLYMMFKRKAFYTYSNGILFSSMGKDEHGQSFSRYVHCSVWLLDHEAACGNDGSLSSMLKLSAIRGSNLRGCLWFFKITDQRTTSSGQNNGCRTVSNFWLFKTVLRPPITCITTSTTNVRVRCQSPEKLSGNIGWNTTGW